MPVVFMLALVTLCACRAGGQELRELRALLKRVLDDRTPAETAPTTESPGDLPPRDVAPIPTPLPPLELAADRWQRLDTTGGSGQTSFAVHPTNADIAYLSSANGGLFKTENAGDTWFSVSSNLGAYRLSFVALDPLDPEIVYVTACTAYGYATAGGQTGEIHRSTNGGRSWAFLAGGMGFQNVHQATLVLPYDPGQPDRFDQDGDNVTDTILVGAWTGPADPPVGGIWRSLDEGQTFDQLALADHNVTAIRSVPGDASALVVTTYEGRLYRSADLGETWTDVTGSLDVAHLSDVAVHPTEPDTLYVTCLPCAPDQMPVWKTENGGQDWQAISAGLPPRLRAEGNVGFTRILIDRFEPDTLYLSAMGYKDSVFTSTNGGKQWRAMPTTQVLPDGRPFFWYGFADSLTIEQAIDGRLFADGGGAWRYPNEQFLEESHLLAQPKWEPATIGVGNVHVNTLSVDPTNGDVLYQGISDFGPYKSTNRGAQFSRIPGSGWPMTVDNYEWNGPYYSSYVYCRLACSTECNRNGAIAVGGTTDFAISQQNPNVVYSAFGSGSNQSLHGGVNKSLDGGKTWQPVGWQVEAGFELNPETCVPYGFRRLAVDPANDQIVFAVQEIPDATGETAQTLVYRTTDGGDTWDIVYDREAKITGLAVSAADPGIVVLTTWADVLLSESGGEPDSWRAISPDQAKAIGTVALSPHQAQVYVVGTRNQGIWYTADGGATWTNNPLDGFFEQQISPTQPEPLAAEIATAYAPGTAVRRDISVIVFAPQTEDTCYVAGHQRPLAGVGVARITQGGTHWERLPLEGLTHRNVYALAIDTAEQFLYAGTNDGTFGLALE